MRSRTRRISVCSLALAALLVGAAGRADAQSGPVSWYRFDTPGDLGHDSAGSNHAVELSGVTQAGGRAGSGAAFVDGYLMLPPSPSLDLRAGDFTLAVFIKGSNGSGNRNWFTKASPSTHLYGLGGGDVAAILFDGGPGGSAVGSTDVFDGSWHHVAGVKRGAVIELWVDGQLEDTGVYTGGSDEAGQFALGRDGACCEYFNGSMDEAKIWSRALSPAEVAAESGLAGATYPFDEGAGTAAHDSSGHEHTASIQGATFVPGVSGTALHFPQATVDDAVVVPAAVYEGFTNQASVEAWIRPSAYPVAPCRGTIFRKRADQNDWGFDLRADGTVDCYIAGAGGVSGGAAPLGAWTKVGCSWDGAEMRLLFDDVEVARSSTASVTPDWLASYFTTEIGNDRIDTGVNCPDYAFRGDIDEVRISPAPLGAPASADLSLQMTASGSAVTTGSTLSYTVTVTSAGPGIAIGPVVTATLSGGTSLVSCAATGGGTCGGAPGSPAVTFPFLASGSSATITLVVAVDCAVADQTILTASAAVASSLDPSPANDGASVQTTAANPPPALTCPANVAVTAAAGQRSAVVSFPLPPATDNCPGTTVTSVPAPGSSFPLGRSPVLVTATDSAGRTTSCTFDVVVSGTLFAEADTFLRHGASDTNEGANERLRIQSSGSNRVLVRFDLDGVSLAGLSSASLELAIAENSDNWGPSGRLVDAHRILAGWAEGNGRNDVLAGGGPPVRGDGSGATWACAIDLEIANQAPNCRRAPALPLSLPPSGAPVPRACGGRSSSPGRCG